MNKDLKFFNLNFIELGQHFGGWLVVISINFFTLG